MTQSSGREWLFTTNDFDRWWEAHGRVKAVTTGLDPDAVKPLAWEAWRTGREQLSEATAFLRLQPARR
jgi:hypothetical protein